MDFLVGGCLRDIILGKPPKDYDIISDAHVPFEPKVVLGKDVLTYRYIIAGKIVDVSSHLNLQKRDFPMNAMALDFQGNFYDPRGGLEDLFNRRLSVEKERLEEDPVRVLRAAKLCAELGLKPVGDKVDGLLLLRQVNEGRLYQEYLKMILSPECLKAVEILKDYFQLPLKVPSTNLPPLAPIRTSACEAHHYPELFGLPPKLTNLCWDLEHMNLSDPPACLCTHGKKAVWAALVQNKPKLIQLYKAWALFRHKAPKTPTAENPHKYYYDQCVAFLREKQELGDA